MNAILNSNNSAVTPPVRWTPNTARRWIESFSFRVVPNRLHIYNPANQSDVAVSLAETPLNLSVGPDGTHAAVAFADAVAYVDLSAASVSQTYSGLAVTGNQVILGNAYFYLFPTYEGSPVSVQLSNGQVAAQAGFIYSNGGTLDPQNNTIYTTSPDVGEIEVFDVSNGPISTAAPFVFLWALPACAPFTVPQDGMSLYSACGGVFSLSTTSPYAKYSGSLSGIAGTAGFAHSALLGQIAAIPTLYRGQTGGTDDNAVNLFSATSYNLIGQFATTPFTVGGAS